VTENESLDRSHQPAATWLTAPLIARAQKLASKLRFVLAVPAVGALAAFTDHPPMWPGMVIALLGEWLQLWASAHLQKNVDLIMSGPYAFVRNPMYLGRFLVGLGLTLLTWRWFLILPYILVFWFYAQARVLGEEARLRSLFRERYEAYCAAVRRWLPLSPGRRFSQARWSWACVLRNREWRVAVALGLGLALLKWRMAALGPLWR